LIPPLVPQVLKTAAARLQFENEANSKEAMKVLYFNHESPLHHGFNKAHSIFIRPYLTQSTSKTVLQGLLQKPRPKFPSLAVDDYLQANWSAGGWGSANIIKSTGAVPEKGKFPPEEGKPDEIPERSYLVQGSSGGGSGSGSGGGGSGGSQNTLGSGLHALADAMRERDGPSARIENVNHVNEYDSLVQFYELAGLSAVNRNEFDVAGIDTLVVLHELVSEAHKDKEKSFAKAIQEFVPDFPLIASLKILAQSKIKPPVVPE
jgi:hypothetical protein